MSKNEIKWAQLLQEAVAKPGKLLEAYRAFHRYSFGNVMLAMSQCEARGIKFGPLATFDGWKSKGRGVRKGEKAIVLCRPSRYVREDEATGEKVSRVYFTYEARWFVLSQTDGAGYEEKMPAMDWDRARAFRALDVTEIEFNHHTGNAQGFATVRDGKKCVAINPVAQLPWKTIFHELGHIVLGHVEVQHGPELPLNIMEVEAESVALLCCEALGLPGAEYARGYIQNWLGSGREIPEKSAERVMSAVDKILRAGLEGESKQEGKAA